MIQEISNEQLNTVRQWYRKGMAEFLSRESTSEAAEKLIKGENFVATDCSLGEDWHLYLNFCLGQYPSMMARLDVDGKICMVMNYSGEIEFAQCDDEEARRKTMREVYDLLKQAILATDEKDLSWRGPELHGDMWTFYVLESHWYYDGKLRIGELSLPENTIIETERIDKILDPDSMYRPYRGQTMMRFFPENIPS